MTNREYMLARIAALDDDELNGLFEDFILMVDDESKKLLSICLWCQRRHGGEMPCEDNCCTVDVGEFMRAEAVFL